MSVAILGSINMDVVLSVPHIPEPGETILASRKALYPGGKGSNQAIASVRAGAPTAFLGAVGEDQYGETLKLYLSEAGVDTTQIETWKKTDTGRAYINVAAGGENAIVVLPGANHIYAYPLKEPAQVTGATVRLAQLEMPVNAIMPFFVSAMRNQGVTRILNAAPAVLKARSLFSLTDIMVVNEVELATYAETKFSDNPDTSDLVETARGLLSRPDQSVVATLGASGSLLVTHKSHSLVPGYPANAIDTTGAGDCFCGALAAFLSTGGDMKEAIRFANAAASLSVETAGASPSMPMESDIQDRINTAKHTYTEEPDLIE
jgi:ribokinase